MNKILLVYHPDHERYIKTHPYGDFAICAPTLKDRADIINRFISECDDDDMICKIDADDIPSDKWLGYIEGDICYGDRVIVYGDSSTLKVKSGEFSIERLRKENFISGSGSAVRAHIAKQIDYPACNGDDWLFFAQAVKLANDIRYVPEVFCYYRAWTGLRKWKKIKNRYLRALVRRWGFYKLKRKVRKIL